jgi:hypothetical protein
LGAVLALANVVHFFFDELPSLGTGRFAFPGIFAGSVQRFFIGHE